MSERTGEMCALENWIRFPNPDAYQKYTSAAFRHVDKAMKKNIIYTVGRKRESRHDRKLIDDDTQRFYRGLILRETHSVHICQ